MRLQSTNYNIANNVSNEFSKWVSDIGDDNAPSIAVAHDEDSNWVKRPGDLMLKKNNGETEDVTILIKYVYGDFIEHGSEQSLFLSLRMCNSCTNK